MEFNPNLTGKKMRKGIMVADDMFSDKLIQVFSRQTGEYLGYVYQGEDPETLQEKLAGDPADEIPPPNINQLNLF